MAKDGEEEEEEEEKEPEKEEMEEDTAVPLPIQTFLWRQTSPFIRPKFRKEQDATAMEQREACKSFEKVLVQNIQFGLSPSLTEAIKSISRWRLIQSALPHVMHCCAALLCNRKNSNMDKLGAAETKLLYTLHWIVLDAAEECADAEYEQGLSRPYNHYLLPIATIEVFIYLFAPLISYLKQSDFLTSFRLENGYKIWDPLFQHRHPDIPSYVAQAKPKRSILMASRFEKKQVAKFGDVFLGVGSFEKDSTQPEGDALARQGSRNGSTGISPATSPLKVRKPSKADVFSPSVPIDKEKIQTIKKIKEASMATYLDVAVLRCLFVSQWLEEGVDWGLRFVVNRLNDIKEELSHAEAPRPRSNSLPIPRREVVAGHGQDNKGKNGQTSEAERLFVFSSGQPSSSRHNSVLELRRLSYSGISLQGDQFSAERTKTPKKLKKTEDLKSFLDQKRFDHFQKKRDELESRGDPGSESRLKKSDIFSSHELLPPPPDPRPGSALCLRDEVEDYMLYKSGDMIRGKSMPSLHLMLEKPSQRLELPEDERSPNKKLAAHQTISVPNPTITITEHSPVASVQFFINQDSGESPREESPGQPMVYPPCRQFTITRSQTDTNIAYYTDTNPEAPGSLHYITKSGQLSLLTVLKAVHSISLKDSICTLRVCEGISSVVNKLLSLGLLQHYTMSDSYFDPNVNLDLRSQKLKDVEEFNVHHLFVDSLMRIYKHLGCPHGCGEGLHGDEADTLRKEVQHTLLTLFQANETQFIHYYRTMIIKKPLQDVIDIYHSFLGFCSEAGASLSPTGPKRSQNPLSSLNPESRTGYATNFGAGFGKVGPKGVEGVVMNHVFKPLVSRMVKMQKELKLQENMSLYCDLRQFINYVKENHGGTFRKVALSALIDSAEKLIIHENQQMQAKASAEFSGGEIDNRLIYSSLAYGIGDDAEKPSSGHRKSFFRKKGSTAGLRKVPSNQSIFDEYNSGFEFQAPPGQLPPGPISSHSSTPALLRINRAASPRLSVTDDDVALGLQQKGKLGAIGGRSNILNWFKGGKPSESLGGFENGSNSPIPSDSYPGTERLARRSSFQNRPKIGPKSSSHVSLTFMKARKRMEDQFSKFVFGKGRNKHRSFEDTLDISRRNSYEFEQTFKEGDMLMLKESKLVSLPAIRNGVLRFSFLLESCSPGSTPDPPLLAAILDIKAPVVARAAFYLECAQFVHACNRGHWPSWMKLNIPLFRPSGPGKSGTASAIRGRASNVLHRTAGRMFYQWAEAIGARLEELVLIEQNERDMNTNLDDSRKKQLRTEDDEEDFLDEASVNPRGSDCPFALKMAASQLLLEITSFLRETHQYLPTRSCRSSIAKVDKMGSNFETRPITANRRWSMALSSLGFSQTSAHSLVSLAGPEGHPPIHPGERRISFVLHEADGEGNSDHSSNTTLACLGDEHNQALSEDAKKALKRLSQTSTTAGRPHLLRRATGSAAPAAVGVAAHTGSFKRRSIKLKKLNDRKGKRRSSIVVEDGDIDDTVASGALSASNLLNRADSYRSRRKASGVSEKSDNSERADISGEESPGVLSDDGQTPDTHTDGLDADDPEIVKSMPWMKVVFNLMNNLNYVCSHRHYCTPNCYKRQMRSCSRLVKAVKKVYLDDDLQHVVDNVLKTPDDKEDALRKEKKLKKIITGPSSPLRRKISVGHNMDRFVDKEPHHSIHSSTTYLPHIDVEATMASSELDPSKAYLDAARVKMERKAREERPTVKYVKNQVKGLFHSSLSMMLKSALILPNNVFGDILILSWELLVEDDQHLTATAAVCFIISSVKCPDQATELLNRQLQHEDPVQRIKAIAKFYSIWRARHQCWPRLEEGAHMYFKVPPPSIEFTLPSPKIALDTMPVADPSWLPQVKSKVEEVTINQEQTLQTSFVTATKTRRKQQIELVHKALQEEQEKLREERECYRISAAPVINQAAYEPALFHTVDDHEEGDDDQPTERQPAHHIHVAQSIFPSSLCSATVTIINLLDDPQVSSTGSSVYEIAYKVIWHCLVEDTALFLRHFFEKLTRENQNQIFQILRRLIRFMPRLPAQAAYTLYNYLIGFVMFYVRSPVEGSQELIGATLSVLWLVVPSVHGLFLKDLKQVLRKEQCDATLLTTANVPSAKKIIVHGPDVGGIPSQFPIQEDTQFSQILIDSVDFFGIDDSLLSEYCLVDTKTNQMHNLNAFVRDFYFFKRSQYPQLSLVRMNPTDAFENLQKQAFTLQFLELGKALMSLSIVKSPYLAVQRVLFLHEELMKLPSFPRKALEANFSLYRGLMGKEMLGMDTLHKIVWVRLIARMFEVTSSFFAQSSDIHLFINVINGALILHCEDAAMLRLCMATFINAAHQFKNIFATNGYLLIMPTILRIYSNHQTNGLLCRTIEFICKQFYIMHRKPFLLQMFGGVAPILDLDNVTNFGDASKVQPKAFFQLLQSLAQYIVDPLDILELVDAEKPLKALDFCYQMDPETLTILDTISLCVTVVAYAADSRRGHQMLTILEAILPLYMKHMQILTMKKETPGGPRTELQTIHNISVCIKTLISNSESLTRNFTGPQRAIDLRGSSMKNATKGACSPPFEIDEDSHSKFMGDSYYTSRTKQMSGDEDTDAIRLDFRRPRDILLNVVAEFLTRSTARLADLSKKVPDLHQKQGSSYELLDVKCHLRLAEVAHSLLKVAPYDPQTMACRGLLRYMNEVLPNSEWRQEAMRPALIMILRRLDKMFNKIAKKSAIKRMTDWDAAKKLLKGVYLTFVKHPYIVHLPHLKSLISVCQNIILGDPTSVGGDSGLPSALPSWAAALTQAPPSGFCSVAVRLVGMQMLQMGETQTLEAICSGGFSSPEKTEIYLMNLIYPMCIRISGGLKDVPKLRPCDTTFTLSVILNALTPPLSKGTGKSASDSAAILSNPFFQTSLHQIGFLGLKIMMVCFERMLSSEWYRVAKCIRELANKNLCGLTLWNFLDFVVTYRTPLFILLLPLIRYKLLLRICENDQEYYYQQLIKEKLQGRNMPTCRSKGQLLVALLTELRCLKEDLVNRKLGGEEKGKGLSVDSTGHGTGHRLSFAFTSAFQSSRSVTVTPSAQQAAAGSGPTSPGPTSPAAEQPPRASITRGWSFYNKDKSRLPLRGLSVKLPSGRDGNKTVVQRFLRRTSYPYNTEDSARSSEGPSDEEKANSQSVSEPRLFRKSTLHFKKKGSRKGSTATASSEPVVEEAVLSEEDRDSSGARKYSGDASSGTSHPGSPEKEDPDRFKHRLQRQKAQSRKTFRFRKSRRGAGFLTKGEKGEKGEDQELDEDHLQTGLQPVLAEAEEVCGTSGVSPVTPTETLLSPESERDARDEMSSSEIRKEKDDETSHLLQSELRPEPDPMSLLMVFPETEDNSCI